VKIRTVREFAALARERRRALKWTQQELADRLGVNREWVIDFEKAKVTVQFGLVLRALRELNISLETPVAPDCVPATLPAIDLDEHLRTHLELAIQTFEGMSGHPTPELSSNGQKE